MIIIQNASWEDDVLPAWKRAAINGLNEDVTKKLPKDTRWFTARIEEVDITNIYVIGSGDWKEEFGTYHLVDIASQSFDHSANGSYHRPLVLQKEKEYSEGKSCELVIIVGPSEKGPFVVIDGNHRAIAMKRKEVLCGKNVFIGLHENIYDSFIWYRQAMF
jgi:hypothetical protein